MSLKKLDKIDLKAILLSFFIKMIIALFIIIIDY
ncbi:hypothetical protein RCH18_000450 [Flavobacterium sp. PL11]|jgi:hypothetical protein|nr:hypothetical protein [Flavobacterium sp. PL11]